MTKRQARTQALLRWEFRAFNYDEGSAADKSERFKCGYCDGWRDVVLGVGATWEEAFRVADLTPIDSSRPHWWVSRPHSEESGRPCNLIHYPRPGRDLHRK